MSRAADAFWAMCFPIFHGPEHSLDDGESATSNDKFHVQPSILTEPLRPTIDHLIQSKACGEGRHERCRRVNDNLICSCFCHTSEGRFH